MARRTARRGSGDRVLESRHLIGLFLGVVLLCAVFFTLGYVMGRSQYAALVHAAYMPGRDITQRLAYGEGEAAGDSACASGSGGRMGFLFQQEQQPSRTRAEAISPAASAHAATDNVRAARASSKDARLSRVPPARAFRPAENAGGLHLSPGRCCHPPEATRCPWPTPCSARDSRRLSWRLPAIISIACRSARIP